MNFYKIFAIISGSLILIAVFILAYKVMMAGMSTTKKNEAKESMMRLGFGGIAIALAPLFIRFLLFINNSMVHLLVTFSSNGSLETTLGNSMKTGNAITTALVIAMFIYLFVKLNIKFIIRQFTIIIFTIFTPVACSLWIINKNVTAASIWAGQIIMNIFMQFIYCFLFVTYLVFLPAGGGWAVSLIWAMMILPLADALMNCLQNLTSRIAGVDNEQMTNRVMGMGSMLGFSLGAIKKQYNNPSSYSKDNNKSDNTNSGNGFKGIVARAKSIVNPSMKLSDEKDYNGNINPIRNVIKEKKDSDVNIPKSNESNKNNIHKGQNTAKSVTGKVARTGFNAAKAYLEIGANMAEGNFKNNSSYNKKRYSNQNVEYLNKIENQEKLGDRDEH